MSRVGHGGSQAGLSKGHPGKPGNARSHDTRTMENKWLADEDNFILKQMKSGALIRVKSDRPRPVDWLVVNLRAVEPYSLEDTEYLDSLLEENGKEFETPMPTAVMDALDQEALAGLIDDVKEYQKIDSRSHISRDFWRSILELCEHKRRQLALGQTIDANPEEQLLSVVADDVDKLLLGKSLEELRELVADVRDMLQSNDPGVDRDFWLQLADKLKIDMAKKQVQEIHLQVIDSRIAQLKKVQRIEEERGLGSKIKVEEEERKPSKSNLHVDELMNMLQIEKEHIIKNGLVPLRPVKLAAPKKVEEKTSIKSAYAFDIPPVRADELEFDDEDAQFSGNDPALIKPEHHNRVIMGFDWNRYNQTHYTMEDPPPKVVQGYKFNLYYPELIGSNDVPTYKIVYDEEESDSPSETCIIVFTAPKPYQNAAFRIVNNQWDHSSHQDAGYVSQFENGHLQLYFRFKKVYYRK